MALFPDDNISRDGIQLGGPTTLCYKCELERMARDRDSDIPYGKLEYKEVFKTVMNGSETCICMNHFIQMCANSHYQLIDTNECMAVPLSALEESTVEEEPIEEPVVETPVEEQKEEKPKKKDKKEKKKEDKE